MSFENLEITKPILNTLNSEGYNTPTEAQCKIIPAVLAGKDLFCCAASGSGKTTSYVISILQKYFSDDNSRSVHRIKALVIVPDAETAGKTDNIFSIYNKKTKLKSTVIPEGLTEKKQVNKLNKGIDILVAHPGSLSGILNQGYLDLNALQILVLDDADVVDNLGLTDSVKQILTFIPSERQTLFFTSAMSPEIKKNADSMIKKPVKVEIKPEPEINDIKGQAVFYVGKKNKKSLLIYLFRHLKIDSTVIFTKTKSTAERVAKALEGEGISSFVIHGSKSKGLSSEIPDDFRSGVIKALVADDAAAPELNITGLSHVFNYDIPEIAENYIERIGRTGNDGFSGTAVSFCDKDEIKYIDEIVKFLNMSIPVIEEHPFKADFAPVKTTDDKKIKNIIKPQTTTDIVNEINSLKKDVKTIPSENKKYYRFKDKKHNPGDKPKQTVTPSAAEQLSIFPAKETETTQREEILPTPETSAAEIKPAQDKKINVRSNKPQFEKRNFQPSGKKPFHKKKKYSHDNRRNFDKKRQQQEPKHNSDKINPVVDNRSTSELKSLEIANRMHNRNQNKYGNNTERQISKVWTDHEEFISIGYKHEKKNTPGKSGSNSYNGNNHHKHGGKNSFGHKTWQGFDRNGTNQKFDNSKKKDSGTFNNTDSDGNSNFNSKNSFHSNNNQQNKKKKFTYHKNKWKK